MEGSATSGDGAPGGETLKRRRVEKARVQETLAELTSSVLSALDQTIQSRPTAELEMVADVFRETLNAYLPQNPALNGFAATIRELMGTSMGIVSILGEKHQHFVGRSGTDLEGTPMSQSFCVNMRDKTCQPYLFVEDPLTDERFRTNPLVTNDATHIRHYFGVPIVVEGHVIGGLCVLDQVHRPRPPPEKVQIMENMAKVVSDCVLERTRLVRQISLQSSRIVNMLQQELQFEAQQQFMQAEMRLREDSVNQVCHEIRSHMATIRMTLEDVQQEISGSGSSRLQLEDVGIAMRSLECQDRILRMRLDMGRLLSGAYKLQLTLVDLVELARGIMWRQERAGHEGVRFLVEACTEELWAETDAHLLEQLLENLVSNARKHTFDGFVKVQLSMRPSGDTKQLRIVVTDTGSGIRADQLAKLFHKYGSVENHGTGLGLYLVDRIANTMGGTVRMMWTRTLSDTATHAAYHGGNHAFHGGNHAFRSGSEFEALLPMRWKDSSGGSVGNLNVARTVVMDVTASGANDISEASAASGKDKSPKAAGCGGTSGGEESTKDGGDGEGNGGANAQSSAKNAQKCGRNEESNGKSAQPHAEEGAAEAEAAEVEARVEASREAGWISRLPCLQELHVLIVDDTKALRRVVERRFQNLDGPLSWSISAAETGEEALTKLKTEAVHIIILDENMSPAGGTLSGTECIRILRNFGYSGVIIGFSGYDNAKEMQRDAGADATWDKPPPNADRIRQDVATALVRRNVIETLQDTARFQFQARA